MDPSYILVGALTAISLGLLVWIEIRSRRNAAVQSEQTVAPAAADTPAVPKLRSRERQQIPP